MSKAGAGVAPRRSARLAAADGVAYGCVTVETMTAPSWEASMPAFCQRLAGGAFGHVDDADVGGRPVAGDDAGTLADPFIGGIDPLAHVVVGHDDIGAVGADAQNAGVLVGR